MRKYRTAGVSVYRRKGRKCYYISYRDPLRPERARVHEATPFLIDDPDGERKANALALEKAAAVNLHTEHAAIERWENWVLPYLRSQYSKPSQAFTLKKYLGCWRWLAIYLIKETEVRVPRALQYQHVRNYIPWRTSRVRKNGKPIQINTAKGDVVCLSLIMSEAIRRGWALNNPCQRLRMAGEAQRKARELTAEELALIEAKLPEFARRGDLDHSWMITAYQIARYQGCRLSETQIRLADVSLERGTILLHTKGRKEGAGDLTLMHPKLRPLFEKMIAEGKEWTLRFPKCPSTKWRTFFDWIGLRDAWFHCLRSTVITEMARNGVPISLAMRYVLHATKEIHRSYQRLTTKDLGSAAGAIGGQPSQPTRAAADERMQAAVVAELVRGGMSFAEALQRVGHGVSASAPPPASSSQGTLA